MEDEAIISLYNKRSEAAISETDKKYGKACRGTAYGVLRNSEDTEECVNDTYLKTWNSIPPAQPTRLGAFVCKIARHIAIDMLRMRTAEKRGGTSSDRAIDELYECSPASSSSAVEDKVVLADMFNRFLSELPPKKRIIFMRRYFYMDTPGEIARMMLTTEPAVRMTL